MNRRARRALLLALVATAGPKSLAAPGPAAGASALSEDQIVVLGATGADEIVLRVFGKEKGILAKCKNTRFALTSGSVLVGKMVPSTGCESETTVFSTRHAPLTVSSSWSDAEDTIRLNMGPALREVELDIYIATSQQDAEIWARQDLGRANTVYANNRVGLRFTEGKFRKALPTADLETIGTSCDQADELKSSTLYNANRINVYFVPSIGEANRTPRGFNCYLERPGNKDGAPNIIYVSMAWHSQNTLAHELGHALGLQGITEHTGDEGGVWVEGFKKHNIMWTELSGGSAAAQKHFSLGQAFRMIEGERSWLNRSAPNPRPCHPTRADDNKQRAKDQSPCPPLAFDAPEP